LKIPSTKRTCFVGRKPLNLSDEDFNSIKVRIAEMVESSAKKRNQMTLNGSTNEAKKPRRDEADFLPRPAQIAVRNCTRLDKDFIHYVIKCIAKLCLSGEPKPVGKTGLPLLFPLSEPEWNMGRAVSLSEAASSLTSEDLAKMKSECGGLQTLLRNNRPIFVVEKGTVRLRCHVTDPHSSGTKSKTKQGKNGPSVKRERPCWFVLNHPQGCPVARDCPFHNP